MTQLCVIAKSTNIFAGMANFGVELHGILNLNEKLCIFKTDLYYNRIVNIYFTHLLICCTKMGL